MAFERGYALVIGVGSYTHIPWADIPISVTDAQAVREVLVNPDLCGYPAPQVTLLHDAAANKDGILAALGALAGTAEEHTVLLYYCGHGASGTDGNYYLTTHESRVSNSKVVKGTGISEAELLDALRQIRAKRLLLLFNACHSGELSPSLAPEAPAGPFGDLPLPAKSVDALLSTGEGRVIIAACRPEQKSWIGGGKLSIFTQALVDGLSGQGYVPNNSGFIGAFGLYEHIYLAVKEAAGKLGKVQEPELTVLRGVGPFAVALYKGASDLGSSYAAETVADGMAVRTVEPAHSQRLLDQVVKMITASDERAVAAETISDSTVVTGDHNVVQQGKYTISIGSAHGLVIGDQVHVTQVIGAGSPSSPVQGGVSSQQPPSGDAATRHLRQQLTELQGKYETLTNRVWALDKDLGRELDSERKLILQDRRQEQISERNQIAKVMAAIEQQLELNRLTNKSDPFQSVTTPSKAFTPNAGQPTRLIDEAIRLDVAAPAKAIIGGPFQLAVAVKQPESPLLSVDDLEQVMSGTGSIFRESETEVVKYRVEVTAVGCDVQPAYIVLKLRIGKSSTPCYFQITARRAGKQLIIVTAYQDDEALAAQTLLTIPVELPVEE
ncbi:MAG TPA: caspase family protein [Anaerolineae bacterium]|nr:caspase family protein [Anaerolineae bacterium]